MTESAASQITAEAVASFGSCTDERLREIMQSLVTHLHAFIGDVQLTEAEWKRAIEVLTATGHITDDLRQEFILWSDVLGASMLVDAVSHHSPPGATESTVLGPFYVPGSPLRPYGAQLAEQPAGLPTWVHGVVRSLDGTPLAGAELDVWQNGDNRLYAVQDPDTPEHHLRGRFLTRDDGTFAFIAVRPTAYPIPHDGPVGRMLAATGRHPWRPAHIHAVIRAAGHRTLTTHLFDRESDYIDDDTVFAVRSSLLRTFVERDGDDPERPAGISGPWLSLETDITLVPGSSPEPVDHGRTA